MRPAQRFPEVRARNLEGLDVALPGGFEGERNVVIVAFQRQHQELVDSWVPWLEERAAADPGLRIYELPTIGRRWVPFRRFIDGGMAAAIRDPVILRRTLTIYGNVSLVTRPLGIHDQSTIRIFLVDKSGAVRWCGHGGFAEPVAADLASALRDI